MSIPFKQPLTKEQALQKLKHYCAYQERCHQEVRDKAYTFGLHKKEVEECISGLIEEDYLNEERFAIQYAGGRFRMKHWGRVKIRHGLQQHQVSDYCIKKALKQIDNNDYRQALYKLAERKLESLQEENNPFVKKQKLYDYLMQKGFESDLIREVTADVA